MAMFHMFTKKSYHNFSKSKWFPLTSIQQFDKFIRLLEIDPGFLYPSRIHKLHVDITAVLEGFLHFSVPLLAFLWVIFYLKPSNQSKRKML